MCCVELLSVASAVTGRSAVSAMHATYRGERRLAEPQKVGGYENDAGSSMTFFTFLNLDNKRGNTTTDYVAIN
jgi:hypothetical protein